MNESIIQIKDTTGNPAPLGLLGFGMTTVLLNLHNAGFYELNSMILAMGICYGGAAQWESCNADNAGAPPQPKLPRMTLMARMIRIGI